MTLEELAAEVMAVSERSRGLDVDGRFFAPELARDGVVPTIRDLPRLASTKPGSISDGEILRILQYYGIVDDWQFMRRETAAYVARLTNLQGAAFDAEVDRLINGRNGLLRIARRTQERYSTGLGLQGNVKQQMVRISEGDDSVCEICQDLAGTIATYEEHIRLGLPGARSCLGGDNCRCELLPVD